MLLTGLSSLQALGFLISVFGESPFFVSITVHFLTANQRFRYDVLDHSSRDFQHRDSCKRDISRNYGILRIQHHDWPGGSRSTKIGWRYYILFLVCDVTDALFFYPFLPETKGVTLEAMNDLFLNSPIVVPGNHWQPPLEADVDRVAEKISV
jgi:hypothetical protein